MRFATRPLGDLAPVALTDPLGAGALELTTARAYYAAPHNACFRFKAYKGQEVKDALEAMFHRKCAYCESRYGTTAPFDVEHYRPKGGVEGEEDHPGYWWLAADWQNLLPCCIDCNRRRKHRIATPGMTLEDLAAAPRSNAGKKDSFPITAARAYQETDNTDLEDPLLIDPTVTDPSAHIVWPTDGEVSVAVPAVADGIEEPKAVATIFTFGLNRQGLVEARTEVLTLLKTGMIAIRDKLQKAAATNDTDTRDMLLKFAIEDLDKMRVYNQPSREYSALVQAFFVNELSNLIDAYRHLFETLEPERA